MEQNPENLQARIESGTAQDLKFDPDNANEGTESGDYVLTQSIQNTGVGRGVLTDKNKILLAGNKTAAKVGELGLEDVVFVHTTGNTTVVTVRDDLDLLAPEDSDEFQRAREASIADNWASIKNTQINPSVIARYRERGVKSEKYISESDWERLTSGLRPETPSDNPSTPDNDDGLGDNGEPERPEYSNAGFRGKFPITIIADEDLHGRWVDAQKGCDRNSPEAVLSMILEEAGY